MSMKDLAYDLHQFNTLYEKYKEEHGMVEQARYYVMNLPVFGRSVISNKSLKAGEVIMYCEVLVLSEKDTPVINTTDLQWYTFTFNDKQDCLVLGDGEIFNHSDMPSCEYELINLNGRPMMVFRAIVDVPAHTQLFIDYNADVSTKVDVLSKYTTNLI